MYGMGGLICGGLGLFRRRKSVESVNWDELKSIVCVEEPSGTLHTSA
jgi:hypothetical protein